jgi:hypothetical protein
VQKNLLIRLKGAKKTDPADPDPAHCVYRKQGQIQYSSTGNRLTDLKSDKHDDIGFAFLGLVRLDPGVNQFDQLLEHSLLDDDTFVQACNRSFILVIEQNTSGHDTG